LEDFSSKEEKFEQWRYNAPIRKNPQLLKQSGIKNVYAKII